MKSQVELIGVFPKVGDGHSGYFYAGELDVAAMRRMGRDVVGVSCIPGEHVPPALARLLGQEYELDKCLFVFAEKRPTTSRRRAKAQGAPKS